MLEELLKEDGILLSETEYFDFDDEVIIEDLKESTSQINQYNREAKKC